MGGRGGSGKTVISDSEAMLTSWSSPLKVLFPANESLQCLQFTLYRVYIMLCS